MEMVGVGKTTVAVNTLATHTTAQALAPPANLIAQAMQ